MTTEEQQIKEALFQAFRDDHATLGRGLYDLRLAIDGKNASLAKTIAERINNECGPHIAFEEKDFYPALDPFLSADEVTALYEAHDDGYELLASVLNIDDGEPITEERRGALMASIEKMEAHVADCGELFGAMGGLSTAEQRELLARLEGWRRQAPQWTDLRTQTPTPGL
ncbi:MAG: hemerythrin domain-containing protein [Pseudomonadota bacterium]